MRVMHWKPKDARSLVSVETYQILDAITLSKTSADIYTDYCDIIQNIAEQCGGIFNDDICLKIFEDDVLNNFDKYFFNYFQ